MIALFGIYRYQISIVDISTLSKSIAIWSFLKKINIDVDKAILENIDIEINIDKAIMKDIDIDRKSFGNIDIDKGIIKILI